MAKTTYATTRKTTWRSTMRKIAASICAAALAVGMVPAGAFAIDGEQGQATDDAASAVSNDTSAETLFDLASAENVAEGDEGTLDAEYVQTNDLANSWRYENGERIVEEASSLSAVDNPWSLTPAGYINENGTVISGAVTKGIDVSEHQGVIDWDKVKADGVRFAIIRIAFYGDEGWGRADNYAARNISECERLGIPYGVYVYSYVHSTTAAHDAAQRTISLLEGHTPAMPVYLDLEESDYLSDISKTEIGDIAAAYCGDIANAGYTPGIYSSLSWWNSYLTDSRFSQWERWVAQWNNQCDYQGAYHVWQACSDGKIDGISTDVDVDFEMGWSYADLATDTAIEDFVTRLYEVALGREADTAGLNHHVNALKNGKSAAAVARDFLLSEEFHSRGYSSERQVEILYETMLDRQASAAEITSWLAVFDEHMTFDAIVCGVSNSQEWRSNCATWGVSSTPATPSVNRDRSYAVTSFVNRLYEKVLGRDADLAGLDVQCGALLDGGSAVELADAFFRSDEFSNSALSSSERVTRVYEAMLDREPDTAGLENWVSHLNTGMTIRSVVYNFGYADEFLSCCAAWGVNPGSADDFAEVYASLEPRDRNIGVTAFVYRMYVYCLDRNMASVLADTAGENHQCEAILNGMSAGQIAVNYFASDEFARRGLSYSDEIVAAYRAFFDRFPDEAGYPFWLEKKQNGMTSAELAAGFTESPEFAELCASYGVSV